MSKDIRIFERNELKQLYNELNYARCWLENIDLDKGEDKEINKEYLKDTHDLIEKVRDKFRYEYFE